jgi:hypothetical protein
VAVLLWSCRKHLFQPTRFISCGSIACGRDEGDRARPAGWKRHFGFDKHAVSEVAKRAKQDGGPHKVEWTGHTLAPRCTLEYRVVIRGTSLEELGTEIADDVVLLPVPTQDCYVEVAAILGPKGQTSGFPREKGAETRLIGEGRLSDGRRVCRLRHQADRGCEGVRTRSSQVKGAQVLR